LPAKKRKITRKSVSPSRRAKASRALGKLRGLAADAQRGGEHRLASPSGPIDALTPMPDPELVFGLVGPIGTDLRLVAAALEKELSRVGYRSVHVHVTDAFRQIEGEFDLADRPTEKKYRSYMDAGNRLRERLDRQDALALFTVASVRDERRKLTGNPMNWTPRTAYILNQLKRPEEIETLRRVYGRGFVQISAYSSRERRLDDLTLRIAKSHYREKKTDAYRARAQELISTDDEEEENLFGQRVRNTFPLADVVISAEHEDSVRIMCARFVRAFFGDNFCTPSREEHGMYLAKVAALRSSDLSRQVGAAIVSSAGEIISLGCNEVPRSGGGSYWEGDLDDFRDFKFGEDSNVRVKREIVEDVLRRFRKGGWLSADKQSREIDELAAAALGGGPNAILRDAQVTNLIEFGRIVHAEMAAITEAARLGRPLRGATLYSTTFPCHICARHIVSTGIDRVVFIEPYSKSLAEELYPDSISVEGRARKTGPKVDFAPFIGIAPERYAELFSKGRRKNSDGKPLLWEARDAKPILQRLFPAYLRIEAAVVDALHEMLSSKKVRTRKA
jgi:deoxycytidylate deaminase